MFTKRVQRQLQASLTMIVFLTSLLLPVTSLLGDDTPKAQRVIVQMVGASNTATEPVDPLGITVAGNFAYLCAWDDGLVVVDVSNLRVPKTIGSCDTPGKALDVAVQGKYAYVADGDAGLRIVDVSEPKSPKEAGACATPGEASRVAVAGSYAYVADARKDGMAGGLRVVDVANPKAPKIVGFFDGPKNAMGVAVRGQHAYVADKTGKLWVVDVSNPRDPKFVGNWNFRDKEIGTTGEPHGLFLAGNYAYVADDDSALHIVDIFDPKAPNCLSTVSEDTGDFGEAVAVHGNYAYVADAGGVIVIFDIGKPERPTREASFDVRAHVHGLTAAGDCLYANVAKGRLIILRTLSGEADFKKAIAEHITSLSNRESARNAEAGLVGIGTPAVPYLIEVLKDPLKHRRAFAANVLSKVTPTPADVCPLVEALTNNLKETPSAYCDYYAGALGTLPLTGDNARSATKDLIEMSGSGHQPTAAESIARIGSMGENAAIVVPMLNEALKDKSWRVRWTAAMALRHITPAATQARATTVALVEALEDENAKVRQVAALALKIIDPEAAKNAGIR